jgi:hypothetical protein
MEFTVYRSGRYHVTSTRLGDAELIRLADGASTYFQPGDDSTEFLTEFEQVELAASFNDGEAVDETVVDHWLSQYDDTMETTE